VAQGRSLKDLKFKSKFYPYGPWLALILFVVVLFRRKTSACSRRRCFSWFDFVTDYSIIPLFILFYLGHKFWNKTHLVPLKDADFEVH